MIWTIKLANMGWNLGLFGEIFLRYLRKTVISAHFDTKILVSLCVRKTRIIAFLA